MDVEKARARLDQLDQIDGPQSASEADEAARLAQSLRLVEIYGVPASEVD